MFTALVTQIVSTQKGLTNSINIGTIFNGED